MKNNNYLDTDPQIGEEMEDLINRDFDNFVNDQFFNLDFNNHEIYKLARLYDTFSFERNQVEFITSHLMGMLYGKHKTIPEVKQPSVMETFIEYWIEPIDFIFSNLEYLSNEGLEYPFRVIGGAEISCSLDVIAIGLLPYVMINKEINSDSLLDYEDLKNLDINKDMLIYDSEIEQLVKNEGIRNLIHQLKLKSAYPYVIDEFVKDYYDTIQTRYEVKDLPNEKIMKTFDWFLSSPKDVIRSKMNRLSKDFDDLYMMVAKYALPEKLSSNPELIKKYFLSQDIYFNSIEDDSFREKVFVELCEKYPILFQTAYEDTYKSSNFEKDVVKIDHLNEMFPGFFNKEDGDFYKLRTSPDTHELISYALKYPYFFPGSATFFASKGELKKNYNLKQMFNNNKVYPRILGKMAPINEILILGGLIPSMTGLFSKN